MVDIRNFEVEHFAAVMEIERALFPEDAWSDEVMQQELGLVGVSREYWVAVSGAEVVGYAGLFFLPPDADVQTLAVKAEWQGQGIGTRLLNVMIDSAASRGCTHLMLEVRVDNPRAQDLYLKHGFKSLGFRRDYYGPGLDCEVMRLDNLAEVQHG